MGPFDPGLRNSVLARIRQLQSRIARERTRLYFIEGIRAVLQALDAGIPIETLVYSEVLLRSSFAQKRVRLSRRVNIPVVRVSPEQFRSISGTPRASGIGAIARQHWMPLGRVDPQQGLCWIALGRLRSPGNFGTILRTAEAVGAGGVILFGRDIDPFSPHVVRATMGGLFRLRLVRTTLDSFATWARSKGCTVLGTSPSAEGLYTHVPVDPPLVLMLGEERCGLSDEERAVCTHTARIPMLGRADSLNVGVAAGVILYEVLRRRGN